MSRINKNYRGKSGYRTVQGVFVLLWGLFLSLFILTESLEALLINHHIEFTWEKRPDFSSFFIIKDVFQVHKWSFVVKVGHFIGFGVLMILLYLWLRNIKASALIAILFAAVTEILQLFFGRDGRIYDLIIDLLGILLSFYLLNLLNNQPALKRKINKLNQVK